MAKKRDAETPQAADAAPGGRAPPRLRLKLSELRDVTRELARLYRSMKAERMPLDRGKALVYVLSVLARVLEGGLLDRRVGELEKEVGRWQDVTSASRTSANGPL